VSADPRTLADRLDEIADPNFPGTVGYTAAQDLRAAAALLRRHAALLDAIGPVTNIQRVAAQLPDATSYSLASLAMWMKGIADAVDGPT
jgi:hypothetical protein